MSNKQPKVFLSHASIDKPRVRWIRDSLAQYGIKCWLDEDELLVGDSISRRIDDALDSADFIVFCISQESLQSEWVNLEVRAVLSKQLKTKMPRILPVTLDGSEPPPLLSDFVWADLSDVKSTEGVQLLARAILTRFNYGAYFEETSIKSNLRVELDKLPKSPAAPGFHWFIISGASSSGKDALMHALDQHLSMDSELEILTKYTTRSRRMSEFEYVQNLPDNEFLRKHETGDLLFPYHKRNARYAFDTNQFQTAIGNGTPLITVFTDLIRVPPIVQAMNIKEFPTTAIFIDADREHLNRRILLRGLPHDEIVRRLKSIDQDFREMGNRRTFRDEYSFIRNGDDRAFGDALQDLINIVRGKIGPRD